MLAWTGIRGRRIRRSGRKRPEGPRRLSPRGDRRGCPGAREDQGAVSGDLRGLDRLRPRLRRALECGPYRQGGPPRAAAAHLPFEAEVRPPGGSEHPAVRTFGRRLRPERPGAARQDLEARLPRRGPAGPRAAARSPLLARLSVDRQATIKYRNRMVQERTATKCRARAFLRMLGIAAPRNLWTYLFTGSPPREARPTGLARGGAARAGGAARIPREPLPSAAAPEREMETGPHRRPPPRAGRR